MSLARLEPGRLLWWGAGGVLAYLVIVPLAFLLARSLYAPETGGLTIRHFTEVFSDPLYLRPLATSLLLSAVVTLLSAAVSVPIAWAVAQTDMPARRMVHYLAIGGFVLPPFLAAIAWVILAGPNAGYLNRLTMAVTGHRWFDVFTFKGMAFVILMQMYPLMFVPLTEAFRAVSADLLEAARLQGATRWQVLRTITLPLATPAILAGALLTFAETMALYGVPAILAVPAGQHVMTTQLYDFFQYPIRLELAAAYSLPLLAISGSFLLLQRAVLGRRGFAQFGGKGARPARVALGAWRWPLLGFAIAMSTCSVVLPYATLTAVSLTHSWGAGFRWDNLSFEHYAATLLERSATWSAIAHSVLYGALAASFATLVAGLAAYGVHRRLIRWPAVLSFLAQAPYVIPGVVLAVGLFSAYTQPWIRLYGTMWILILAYATKFLPVAFGNARTGVGRISKELEEAARIQGASPPLVFRDVVLPLAKGSMIGAWILVFIASMREISASGLLFVGRTRVASVAIYDLYADGELESIGVVGVLLLVISLLGFWIGNRLSGAGASRGE